jgi:hypothetical protein
MRFQNDKKINKRSIVSMNVNNKKKNFAKMYGSITQWAFNLKILKLTFKLVL